MGIIQGRPNRKASGGKYVSYRGKRKNERGNRPVLTKIGEKKSRTHRVRGGTEKYSLLSTQIANVYDPKTKKYSKAAIKTVVENPANRHYVRRNIITKGTVIDTEKGKAKVTNRPGQENTINAVLI